jgi:hypothetical protein
MAGDDGFSDGLRVHGIKQIAVVGNRNAIRAKNKIEVAGGNAINAANGAESVGPPRVVQPERSEKALHFGIPLFACRHKADLQSVICGAAYLVGVEARVDPAYVFENGQGH